jgi:hypothetical protein
MNAKPMFKIDALVFWFVSIACLLLIAYQWGFDNGVLSASPICKITCEERK